MGGRLHLESAGRGAERGTRLANLPRDGIPGVRPCVEFDGLTDGLKISSSQITGNSFTMYLVLTAIGTPGGSGIAALWDAPNGSPRGKGLTILDPAVIIEGRVGKAMGGYVNDHVSFPTFENVADTWGRTDPHLYCFSFDKGIGSWSLYVDDDFTTPIAGESCPPQITESSEIWIANESSLAPVSLKIGRLVTYDAVHGSSERATVRTALRKLWPGLP